MKLPLQGMATGRVVAGRGGGGQSQVVQGGGGALALSQTSGFKCGPLHLLAALRKSFPPLSSVHGNGQMPGLQVLLYAHPCYKRPACPSLPISAVHGLRKLLMTSK